MSRDPFYNNLFREILGPKGVMQELFTQGACCYWDGHNFVIQMAAPGLKTEDLSITMKAGVLSIRGERATELPAGAKLLFGAPHTTKIDQDFALESAVDASQILALLRDGILTITVPKKETDSVKVNIQAG